MDFLACLLRMDVPPEDARARVEKVAVRAKELGLVTIENSDTPAPLWVRTPGAWRLSSGENGTRIAVAGARTPISGSGFPVVCSSARTGPAIQFGPDGRGGCIASDHMGIRTIYWTDTPEAIIIASRSSSLVERRERRLNLDAVFHFLNFSAVPTPYSIFEGVHRLGPGRRLTVATEVHEDTFWDLRYNGAPGLADPPAAELFDRIRLAVRDCVADLDPATTGAFLSGGTDSTTVAGLTTEAFDTGLDVFSIVFREQTYTEEPFMAAAAERFPLRRHSFELDQTAFMRALEPAQKAYDEPYANPSVQAAYYCFLLAQQAGKTCLLAGDGGDEIFGGNERYLKDRILGMYGSIPRMIRAAWEQPLERLPLRGHIPNRLRKMVRRAQMPNPDRFYADMEFASAHWANLPGPAFRDHPLPIDASAEHVRGLYRTCGADDELHRLLYLDMKLAIADNDLRKVVGCGSIFGIEPRFPLLDLNLVEFVNGLSSAAKLRHGQKRYLFKKAMKGYLPDRILFKRKQGMGIPLGRWLRGTGPIAGYARERLDDGAARMLFDHSYLVRVWEQHQRGEWDHSEDLWRIVVLVDWYARHARGD
jgi:asparagine synthase (glutamine-hydrolysing)